MNGKTREKVVRVSAPATVGNMGSGFDVLGMAIDGPADVISAGFKGKPGVSIYNNTSCGLPVNPLRNAAAKGVMTLLGKVEAGVPGLKIVIEKKIPPGGGMGSSAASAVASVVAVNELLGKPFSREELLPFCLDGEEAASRSRHADNVAPCLFGGICLTDPSDPGRVISLPVPGFLHVCLVYPALKVKTSDARRILKKQVPLADAARQWSRVATLVAGLYAGNAEWIGQGVEDRLIEPQRSPLIKGFLQVKEAALSAGALNSSISGAGPSVFALCDNRQTAEKAGNAMQKAFEKQGVHSTVVVSLPNTTGARILESL
ncbi:MAG TPA: homoserine kinase [Bacteroidetes bacterium]|nr:homoserine kinase [Bacteroidota bacterium]